MTDRLGLGAPGAKWLQIPQEPALIILESGEDILQVLVSQVTVHGFTEHGAEVGGQREIASFIELRLFQPGPASIDFSAFNRTADNKHHIRVTVIGAAIAVLTRGAAKF